MQLLLYKKIWEQEIQEIQEILEIQYQKYKKYKKIQENILCEIMSDQNLKNIMNTYLII